MAASQQAFVVHAGTTWSVKASGELVVLGEDGQIRRNYTIGRPDPGGSRG